MTRAGIRVVHLSRGRDWRGGERQVRLLVRMLRDHEGISQRVATGAGSRLAGALHEDGQRLLELPWATAYDPRVWLGVVRQLRGERRNGTPLLLHAHDSHALTLGLFAGGLLEIPLVATRRSDAPAGRQWRRATRVIAISAAVEQALLHSGVPAARISVVRSAIDLADRAQRPAGIASPEPFIIAVGALTHEKGHETLLDAIARLTTHHPAVRLRILGDGPERPHLMRRAGRLGIESRVEWMGEVADPSDWIAQALLLVQPSYREALGTAVLEAMARGTPVIASRTGGLVELLDGGAGLLVPPRDSTSLAEAIEALLEAPDRRADFAHAARVRITEYDAPGMAERVVQVYRSALGDP